MANKIEIEQLKKCTTTYALAINEAIRILGGKWRLSIVAALMHNNRRFKDIQSFVGEITPRMLSKELKELELNGVVKRVVHDTTPVLIEYELNQSGKGLITVIEAMLEWGLKHRKFSFPTQ